MKVDVLLGLQWGDEGKGKVVDVLTPNYDVIARFQGGPNAGHSLEFNNIRHVLHTIPSGIFHKDTINIIGNGVVIDPVIFKKEIDSLVKMGVDASSRLLISKRAHLILPTHRILDAASEAYKGKSKIGSTLKGIGPAYMDKTGRNGLRIGDITGNNFIEKYQALVEKHKQIIRQYKYTYNLSGYEKEWYDGIDTLKGFQFVDSEQLINTYTHENKKVLAEGAQGTLLDIDFGTYPYVTSSNTICAGACTGLGIAPNKIGDVFGIFKAYCTRVGSGPFPTELFDETGKALQKFGNEFGSTTGRARRCGWLDLPALKYAIMINGATQLIMTKADVMDQFDIIKVAVAYKYQGQATVSFPFDMNEPIEPVYKEMKGWKTDLTKITAEDQFPDEFLQYMDFIEKEVGVPVKIVSVGPDRKQIIFRKNVKTYIG
ncbi:MAG: adenylosuccinate synthase [Bacteroidia bacterium]|nr:adenylosuccinate synthase [Bacteroidia bacterium]